jgi:hypothetical protein
MTIIPYFFIENIMHAISVEENLIVTSKQLIFWIIPSLLMRVFSDNLKSMIVNQGLLKQVGGYLSLSMVLFLASAFLLIVKLDLGAMGMGLSVLIYESLSAGFLYFFIYRNTMD